MNKYHVTLAEDYTKLEPFMIDWDYELLGDKLRAEFDQYFAEQEKAAEEKGGKKRDLFKGEYVKKFMILKRINLVDNPADGNLKSVFVLRKGEEKMIDKRAKDNLASRFEYKVKTSSDGVSSSPLGFMKFVLVEGSEDETVEKSATLQVSGDDVQYFEEEKAPEVEVKEQSEYVCDECGKEFDSGRALNGHKISHKKK